MLTEEEWEALQEEKEINDLIDEAAEEYRPIEEILNEQGMTLEQAVHETDAFRQKFFALLRSEGIPADNISRICREVAELTEHHQSSDAIFLYTALLTENGLLFGKNNSDEQAVLLWLEHKERVDYLTQRILNEPEYSRRLDELRHYKPQTNSTEINRQEQAMLYEMAIENTFLYNARKNNIFLHNLGELVRLVNANECYRAVKPYIYFAVLSRKHKLMMEREHYSPNIPKIYDYQEYTIQRDNNKNFNTYQSYLELYGQFRESYEGEIDGALTDYCMANTSNLCEWFYENCEPDDVIPMSLSQVAEVLSNGIWLMSEETDVGEFMEANPVFEIACQNLLACTEDWKDFISAMQNGEELLPYAERLYQKAVETVPCADRDGALVYAQCLLYHYMEEYNRQLLVKAVNHFMIS